ncbi:MAG: hypothetical protein PGN13_13875 [Patulibacter minatonensis]
MHLTKPRLPSPAEPGARLGASVALAVVALVAGAAIAQSALALAALAVLVGAGVVLWAANQVPLLLVAGALASLVLVPLNGVPLFGLIHPGVASLLVLAVMSVAGLTPLAQPARLSIVDLGAAVVGGALLLSVPFSGQPVTETVEMTMLWGGCYLVGRALGARPRDLLVILALAGLLASPFVLPELAGQSPFRVFGYAIDVSAGSGVDEERLGGLRVQGAFSHPILFAMFLAIAAVSALTLWLTRPAGSGRRAHGWLAIGVFLVGLQVLTVSRTGWLMLTVAAAGLLLFTPGTIVRRKNVAAPVAAVLAVVLALALPTTRSLLLGTGGSAADQVSIARSTAYRTELRERIFRPGYLTTFGRRQTLIGPGRVKSIDNTYLVVGWYRGRLALVGFVIMAIGLLLRPFRVRRSPISLAVVLMAFSVLVALASVALFAQIQVLAWILFGAAATVTSRGAALAAGNRVRQRRASRASGPTAGSSPVRSAATP